MTTDKDERKKSPMARGLLDYFPDALAYVAHVSFVGNEQHNPGEEMHWAREKSTDHADCIIRHLAERGTVDPGDNLLHSGKVAWRALAMLQLELEAISKKQPSPFDGEWNTPDQGDGYWTIHGNDPVLFYDLYLKKNVPAMKSLERLTEEIRKGEIVRNTRRPK